MAGVPMPGKRIQVAIASTLASAGLLLAQPAISAAASFEFRNFANVDALKLNGDAHPEGKALRLTDATQGQAGSAFTRKLRVDPKKNFKTQFRLDMSQGGSELPADGMTFALHRGPAGALGLDGGDIGYYDGGGTLADPSVAVVFGTYVWNLVYLDVGGVQWAGAEAPPFDLNDGPFNVWVNYNAAKKKLKVYLSQEATRPESPLLQRGGINLRNLLGGLARAGFTAGTGDEFVAHDVRSWSMRN